MRLLLDFAPPSRNDLFIISRRPSRMVNSCVRGV